MTEELEGGRLYSDWRWVLLSVVAELEVEEYVQLTLAYEVGICGHHSGKHLYNRTYGVLSHS